MEAWFVGHEFIASWLSAIACVLAAVLALISTLSSSHRAAREGKPFKWNAAVLRIGFLLCLSGILSPAIPSEARGILGVLVASLAVSLAMLAYRE